MTERTYLDFDVLVEPASATTYRARVLNSPVGETRPVSVTIPFSALELDNFLLRIGRPRRYLVRSEDAPEATAVREFGGRLFDAVFHDQMLSALTALRCTSSAPPDLRATEDGVSSMRGRVIGHDTAARGVPAGGRRQRAGAGGGRGHRRRVRRR